MKSVQRVCLLGPSGFSVRDFTCYASPSANFQGGMAQVRAVELAGSPANSDVDKSL
jgi:hypothetical protein